MIIIGAGLSGLLCGLLNPGAIIYETGPRREPDHKALFRCKSDKIGKVLGTPFKKVNVHKAIWFDDAEAAPSIRLGHMYSNKVTGSISGRSILDTDACIRYIPPDNFVEQLRLRCNIVWDYKISNLSGFTTPIVSTIPFADNLKICGMTSPDIPKAKTIFVNQIPLKNCDSHCTIYYPNPEMNTYRASIVGDTMITEGVGKLTEKELWVICESLGVNFSRSLMNSVRNHVQEYGKIFQMDEPARTEAITQMTINHGLYSLGRFATWRPKVMLDDVLEDIYHIHRMICGGNYAALKLVFR